MRRVLAVALLAMAAVAVAAAQDKKPINAKCPVKGEPVNANITADYEGKVIGFCWGGCRGQFTANAAQFVAKIPELKAPAAPAKPQAKPLNAKCPVKGEENADPKFTITVSGKTIGFCCQSCLGKFNRMPGAYINNIPELRGGSAKKPDDKPGADPKKEEVHTGPCEIKKTAKGMWCLKCDRELTVDDVRNKLCKRCETKPEEIEYCVKGAGFQFTAECHPNKKDTKPISWWGKTYKVPTVVEDRARITYVCESCQATGGIESQFKHKEGCKPTLGKGLKQVCAKSGKEPHASDK